MNMITEVLFVVILPLMTWAVLCMMPRREEEDDGIVWNTTIEKRLASCERTSKPRKTDATRV